MKSHLSIHRRFAGLSCLALLPVMGSSAFSMSSQTALEILLETRELRFDLTRGQAQTFAVEVRNRGDAILEIREILFGFASDSRNQPPPEAKRPKVIGLDNLSLASKQMTTIALEFPAFAETGEYKGELYLVRLGGPDIPESFASFPIKVEEPRRTTLSTKVAGWLAFAVAALVLILTIFVRGKDNKHNFFQSPDGNYSVSRFQVWLWTVVILFSYGYLFLSFGPNIDFPETVWGLLGISVGSIAVARTIAAKRENQLAIAQRRQAGGTGPKTDPPATQAETGGAKESGNTSEEAGPAQPRENAITNMLSEDSQPSIMRLQMFSWTIGTAFYFLFQVYTTSKLWDVPSSLLILMGISHGGYLVDKGAASLTK